MTRSFLLTLLLCLTASRAAAQLSTNPDKFLGNITTSGKVDYGSEMFYTLWNQITPENESKWSSVEGSRRGSFYWGCDDAFNYAKRHNFPFKFHCLIWGAQYPSWIDNLSTQEQYKSIVEWMDAIKKHYPSIDMIDVVNEAVQGHQPAPYRAALGGEGRTGYDWIIKAFEMAHERWPDAILIYNDYNTFQWQRTQFIDLCRTLRDAGAPIDAYGCQSHDLTDMNVTDFKNAMKEIQNALKMPMYSSEYDIGTTDDALQLQRYKEQIPYMWEADYCAGITLWGYIYGHTWTTNGNSGIIRNGKDRPAMTWLREYMKTEAAQQAKSPFPGMKKEASVYIRPAALNVTKGEPVAVEIRARLRTKAIDHIDFYVKNQLLCTFTEAPYTTEFTPETLGRHELKAVVVATDGTEYQRLSGVTAFNPRAPYNGAIALPGTLQAENFDTGADGIAFHDSDSKNEGTNAYRNNGAGVDIVKSGSGYSIGYTADGEWLEYTVEVKEAGLYEFDAYMAADNSRGAFSIALSDNGQLTPLTESIPVATTGSYSTYKAVHGRLSAPLAEGVQQLRFSVDKGGFDVDRIVFKRLEINEELQLALTAEPSPATVSQTTTLRAETSNEGIADVKFYVNNVLLRSVTEAPFETTFRPATKGTYPLAAIATDADGKQSPVARYTLTVNPKRTPYHNAIKLPGILQAENFDKGGEGFTFHDSDSQDEGKASYRTDNEGVDIVKSGSGYVIGYTDQNEWLEYTVNVTEPGKYTCEATVSSGVTGSAFTVGLVENAKVVNLGRVNVPQTGSNNWDTYKVVKVTFSRYLDEGEQILRITINGKQCNIDKLDFKCILNTAVEDIAEDAAQPSVLYNLAGQRVRDAHRGIYILNGRKVMVK
ncbi:MAG: endo-1,4-beta-xylanase [Bacteroidaceae bacterium]|nr:endo-1,4-beta-xylanase [Bacteroidaceae bacterium]